jgi:hypothetical protein
VTVTSVGAALAAALAALILAGGSAAALEPDEEQELAQRISAGVRPQVIQLNDAAIDDYKRPPKEPDAHEFLVIRRAGDTPIKLADRSFAMRTLQVGGGPGPNAIFVGSSGGAHCCYTAHLIWIEGGVRHQAIELQDSELKIETSRGTPLLRFYDFGFAYWNAAFADSPAPAVVLAYDPRRGEYTADATAMRKPAPTDAALAQRAAEIRKAYESLRSDDLDPALWAAMLDLIYSGNAGSARALLDAAWPPAKPGKDDFLEDFTQQLWTGATWQRFELGRVLDAGEAFPPPASAP